MKVKIKYKDKVLSENIMVASTFYARLKGLMFQERLVDMDGLLIDPCNSIHTFFMKFPLDVVFIGKDDKVIKVLRNVIPWRMTWIYFKAIKTLEIPAGKLPLDINEGDVLEVASV